MFISNIKSMITLLTPTLLEFLSANGYRFCLSKTIVTRSKDADVAILLKPVKTRPLLKRLSLRFDTYFSINREPKQMAEGIDGALVIVEVTPSHLTNYITFFLDNFKKKLAQ